MIPPWESIGKRRGCKISIEWVRWGQIVNSCRYQISTLWFESKMFSVGSLCLNTWSLVADLESCEPLEVSGSEDRPWGLFCLFCFVVCIFAFLFKVKCIPVLTTGDTLTLGTQACYTGALTSFFLLNYNPRVKRQEWNPFVLFFKFPRQKTQEDAVSVEALCTMSFFLSKTLISELMTPETSKPLSYLRRLQGSREVLSECMLLT